MKIIGIEPTVFMKMRDGGLRQLIKLSVDNPGPVSSAFVRVECGGVAEEFPLGELPAGNSAHDIFIGESRRGHGFDFILMNDSCISDRRSMEIKPPKRWVVHVVQNSHHDPGYTDLPSRVLKRHDRWLDEAIDIALETDDYSDDARFRLVVEQAWSLDHFLRNAGAARAAKAIELVRQGRFEVTALFGNMTTELCGHEELARTLYHAFALKRKYGFDIVSAEHNDITGISWGLSTVLTEAGIKIFCAGLPLYYSWGGKGLPSFWDQKAVFGREGPGAFRWEAPSGKKVLFWSNNSGCGGDCRGALPDLAARLRQLESGGYPYSVLRWPVTGAASDNSPYIGDYARTIRDWNGMWAFPHLICSTNAKFYMDLEKQTPDDLPVWRGELAGQDYPVGATSTAAPTAVNRNNHTALPAAETLSSLSSLSAGLRYPRGDIEDAYEDMLWYDEHAWGFHFPGGPAAKASELEKQTHAWRAAALAHGIGRKSMAAIADKVIKEDGAYHLVVFNATQQKQTGPVHTFLREFDNACGDISKVPPEKDEKGAGYLRVVSLNNRWQAAPPPEFFEQGFKLSDISTGTEMPYQIVDVESPADTVPYAAERLGLGEGTKRYGFFELPQGLMKEICFIAGDVPPMGYRTYKLTAGEPLSSPANDLTASGNMIENKYYRITADGVTGGVTGIWDKSAKRELVDGACNHGFNTIVVRDKDSSECIKMKCSGIRVKFTGPACACLEITGSAHGHPVITQTVRLYAGIKRIHMETRILKDATPLLNAHLAFPFKLDDPEFRYEGALSVMTPIADYLPGSQSDTIAVQNWVMVSQGDYSVLWSSLDAPVAGFGGLWPGYTSPAHSCHFSEGPGHAPLKSEDLKKGWIYSEIFSNNYGTNFSVSQVADVLFRYVIATTGGEVPDSKAASFGRQSVSPLESIFTKHTCDPTLPATASMLEIDNPNIALLTMKQAENGNGYIFRLWNVSDDPQSAGVKIIGVKVASASTVNMAEEDTGYTLDLNDEGFTAIIGRNAVVTVRVVPAGL